MCLIETIPAAFNLKSKGQVDLQTAQWWMFGLWVFAVFSYLIFKWHITYIDII